jgi:hypothetical protein
MPFYFPLKKMTKRRETFTHHAYRHYFFFVIAVDAPRRARGRGELFFSCPEPRWSGVYVTKRAFSTKNRKKKHPPSLEPPQLGFYGVS